MKKLYRVAVEGATTDGREIDHHMILQMAKNYDQNVYCAQINIEHIKSYSPDSTFKRYGTVKSLIAKEIKDGKLAGKLALFAELEPTKELIALNKKCQKLFPSVEISPSFADTKEAYLMGLAVTDDPASLGTELLKFSQSATHNPLLSRKQNQDNLFTSTDEENPISFAEIEDESTITKLNTLKNNILSLFNNKEAKQEEKNQLIIENLQQLVALNDQLIIDLTRNITHLNARLDLSESEIKAFKGDLATANALLSSIPDSANRPVATGATAELQTDC